MNAITTDRLWKRFRLYHERNQTFKETFLRRKRAAYEELWALREVTFGIQSGQTVGIIGENGSGKSTLLKVLARILRPDRGSVRVNGRLGALLELGAGFHPDLSGRENVFLNGSILGFGRKDIRRRFDEIVAFAELERFIDTPVKNYSSGMYVRLGFAIATLLEPDVLLVDEILAVGDEAFQRRSSDKLYEMRRSGATVVVVSHALGTLRSLCDRVLFLHGGELMGDGEPGATIDLYLQTVSPDRGHALAPPGGGTIRFVSVDLLDEGGLEAEASHAGAPLTIRMTYEAAEPVERPVFRVGIHRDNGDVLALSHSKLGGIDLPQVSGRGVVDLRLGVVPLVTGRYWLSVAILDWSCLHVYQEIERARGIDVLGSTEMVGTLDLDGRWSAEQPAALPTD